MMKEPSVYIQLAVSKCDLAAARRKFPLRSHSSRQQHALAEVIMGTARELLTVAGQSNPRRPLLRATNNDHRFHNAAY